MKHFMFLLFVAGCCCGCNATNSDVAALKSTLRVTGADIVAKQEQSLAILRENTTALAAIKSQVESFNAKQTELDTEIVSLLKQKEASQVESETSDGIGGDLSSDPLPTAETVVNESPASDPGMQPVSVSAVELLVCSTGSCSPCKRLWADVGNGKLDGFTVRKVEPFEGIKGYPAIRFRDDTSDTGWKVIYNYNETIRLYLRAKLLGEDHEEMQVLQSRPISLSHSEMVKMHNQLHGGGSWTWPGDLAKHLQTKHGVSLTSGGEPVSGSFFPVSREIAVLNSSPAVRSFPQRKGFFGWSRNTSRKSCPAGGCP